MKPSNIGGQAVMEGIMMRHKDKYSIAVRRPDKEIEVKVEDYKCIFGKARIWRKPIIRGMVSFIDSLVTGTKCLMYSAEIAGDEEDEEETVVAGFIHEFKRNFKQSTIAYFFILLAIFVMYFEFLLVKRVTGFISTFYTGILVTELIFMGLIVPFLFPLIARYNNKLGTTVRNSLALAITYKGSWLKVFIAWFAPIFICVRYPIIFVNIWYLWVLFIFGAIAYGTSTTMRKIFRLNEKKLEETARKAEEEAKKAKEEAEAAAKLLEAEAEAEEKDKEDTGNKEDLDSEQA